MSRGARALARIRGARVLAAAGAALAASACSSDPPGVARRTDPFGVEEVVVASSAVEQAPTWAVETSGEWDLSPAALGTDASATMRAVQFHGAHALRVVTGPASRVLLVDRRGGSTRALGAPGRGVGAFLEATLLETSAPALVAVFDAPLRRLTFFDADGSASVTVLPKHEGGPLLPWRVLPDGSLLARGVRERIAAVEPRGIVRDSEVVVRISPSGRLLESFGTWAATDLLLEVQPDSSVLVQEAPNARRLLLAADDSLVVIASGGSWEVVVHDASARRRRTLRVADRPSARADGWPAIDRLLLDDAGRLWMRETPDPEGSQAQWVVVSLAGVPLGRVRFDPQFTPHEVRGDEVAGVWRDRTGRETVRVLRVLRVRS